MFYYLGERCYVIAEPFMSASCELPEARQEPALSRLSF